MGKFVLPRLYAIVDAEVLAKRGVELRPFVEELRNAGVRLVQYRDKVGSPQDVLRAAEVISRVFAGVDATLILNDRADLAVLAGWDGIHVGQGDLSVEDVRRVFPLDPSANRAQAWGSRTKRTLATEKPSRRWGIRGAGAVEPMSQNRDMGHPGIVGISTHTAEQVRFAEITGADYVAVGPVFGTTTKKDAELAVGLEGVRRARALTRKPLVAIGGITRSNAHSVIEAGADAVAVISGLLVEDEPVTKVARDFLAILR